MTEIAGMLDTGIARSRALLPSPPSYWSYSSLKEIEACPRRFALARATYPDLWDGRGYPSLPSTRALFGDVVHSTLEVVVKALAEAGVESPQAVEATMVLRDLGGITAVVEEVVTKQLAPLEGNPRVDLDRHRRIARELRAQIPDARVQVQTYLSRTVLVPRPSASSDMRDGSAAARGGQPTRRALGKGSHAEAVLVADELRLLGRVDLLTISGVSVDIVDYKTGVEAPGHHEQLRLYALLWDADRQANPARLPAASLTVAYRDRDVDVPVPSSADLDALRVAVSALIEYADVELKSTLPTPLPSPANCERCAVRHLCAAYWDESTQELTAIGDGEWFDYEGKIGKQNGQRSWWVIDPETGIQRLLLRTTSATPPFATGDHVRLLGLRHELDPETNAPVALLTAASEVFQVVSS
ncbi:PD-(D/E)XK nuclease family protein [Microbacterium sp. JZ37]|uniref:PD-(D/E)XK nuclease family protein n=1 Tax=Microbacterium sp. JZ37 TaxID=2654193 RepID=UPI002B49B22C|nr:PD-(D/E)XK nuclease family protein [Microbacterium sp. JZ37]WRH18483.1 hypothetical protein GC092_13790 [Microbacterium sp. JZ37]